MSKTGETSRAKVKDMIKIEISRDAWDDLCMQYSGTREALLEAGAVTEKEFSPIAPGKTRRDAAGDRLIIERRPSGYYVRRHKDEETALAERLPGVAQWLAQEAGVPAEIVDQVREILQRFRMTPP